jgi:polyisoprenoid-binding protein YceI
MSARIPISLFALAATAAGALEPDQVQIRVALKTGGHSISATSHALEWSAEVLDDGRAQLRLSVPLDSFDSGDPAFDSALRKALDTEHHPFAEIDGIAQEGRLVGTLELAGVARPIDARLHVERVAANFTAVASFAIELAEHGVVLAGVDPHATVEASVRLAASPDAVVAGGSAR